MHRYAIALVVLVTGCERCDELNACDPTITAIPVGGIWTIKGEGERAGCSIAKYNGKFELGPSSGLAVIATGELSGDSGVGKVNVDGQPVDGTIFMDCDSAREDSQIISDSMVRSDALFMIDGIALDGTAHSDVTLVKDFSISSDYFRPDDALVKDSHPLQDSLVFEDSYPDYSRTRRDASRAQPTNSTILILSLHGAPSGFTLTGQVRGNCVTFETREESSEGPIIFHFTGKITNHGKNISGDFKGTGPADCIAGGEYEVSIR